MWSVTNILPLVLWETLTRVKNSKIIDKIITLINLIKNASGTKLKRIQFTLNLWDTLRGSIFADPNVLSIKGHFTKVYSITGCEPQNFPEFPCDPLIGLG